MGVKLIDLSMPVHNDMLTFPRIVKPTLEMYETWEEFAEKIGAAQYGATWLTASYRVELSDHVGTHMDALRHLRDDAPGPEGIPLEYCYGDGVLLDFRHKEKGAGISAAEVQEALAKIDYELKPRDIVLIWTGAGAYQDEQRYLTDHCGMTREATLWLIDQGIKMMGIDAITFDPPVWAMFERKQFWEAHRVMQEREYYHLENLTNFDQLPGPYGFKLAVFPIKWVNTTAAPVRAVAIVEE
ncbi:MAG: cyclase family protein [Thermomicrobiaceae bacterium]|nr:cyclase family protein [Thermomicrobiaceae bacterium]